MKADLNHIILLIKPVLSKYGIQSASIVGSFAYGNDTESSDIDLVIEINKPISFLTFASIKIELEEILNRKVDLLERSAIKPRLKQSILLKEIVVV
jgi:uncharacterized protein